MANKLTDLEIDEVSLVDKGANKKSKVVLCKRDAADKEIVSKCLDAVEKGDVSRLTPEHFEKALEQLTRQRMAEDNTLGYHRAYCEVAKTEDGNALYSGYLEAVRQEVCKRDSGAA